MILAPSQHWCGLSEEEPSLTTERRCTGRLCSSQAICWDSGVTSSSCTVTLAWPLPLHSLCPFPGKPTHLLPAARRPWWTDRKRCGSIWARPRPCWDSSPDTQIRCYRWANSSADKWTLLSGESYFQLTLALISPPNKPRFVIWQQNAFRDHLGAC